MTRIASLILALLMLAAPVAAQDVRPPDNAVNVDTGDAARAATGGAQTREDIMRRQEGLPVDSRQRILSGGTASEEAAALLGALGTRGDTSDAQVWEELRFNQANVTTQAGGPATDVIMQPGGMWWYTFRAGPLRTWGGYLLLGMIGLLAIFYLIRGRIRIQHGKAGATIERFNAIERFAHWLLAGSFILLGITGLITLFGRVALIPYIGKEAFSPIAIASKWIHNNVSWAFMLALILVFVFWVIHNLPHKSDIKWILQGGGIFTKAHPPARKFNAGQKVIFWSVILLGASISASGLSLLFPFELPMFAKTFAILNDLGVPGWLDREPFPTVLLPHEEMQYAQLWHAIVSFVLMAIIIAHIYIGTLGMEGAYDAMGSGQVDINWAKEHHSLWVDEVQAKKGQAPSGATPAE